MKLKKVIFYVMCILLFYFVTGYKIAMVSGHSMEPTLTDGEFCILQTRCTLEDGDIIVIDTTDEPNIPVSSIIKRYIATQSSSDEIYVLGDNRSHSYDSRKFGKLKRKNVIGKVILTF